MNSVKSLVFVSALLALSVIGCDGSSPAASDEPASTSTPVSSSPPPRPAAAEGTEELNEIAAASVPVTDQYVQDFGADREAQLALVNRGLDMMRILTLDYEEYRTKSGALTKENYMSLMPDFEKNIKPKVHEGLWKSFVAQWENLDDDKRTMMYLATRDGDNAWTTDEGGTLLTCPYSDTPWTTTFSNPELTAQPYKALAAPEATGYNVTTFKITAHHSIPCDDGKVLRTGDKWTLTYEVDGTLFNWNRNSAGMPASLS